MKNFFFSKNILIMTAPKIVVKILIKYKTSSNITKHLQTSSTNSFSPPLNHPPATSWAQWGPTWSDQKSTSWAQRQSSCSVLPLPNLPPVRAAGTAPWRRTSARSRNTPSPTSEGAWIVFCPDFLAANRLRITSASFSTLRTDWFWKSYLERSVKGVQVPRGAPKRAETADRFPILLCTNPALLSSKPETTASLWRDLETCPMKLSSSIWADWTTSYHDIVRRLWKIPKTPDAHPLLLLSTSRTSSRAEESRIPTSNFQKTFPSVVRTEVSTALCRGCAFTMDDSGPACHFPLFHKDTSASKSEVTDWRLLNWSTTSIRSKTEISSSKRPQRLPETRCRRCPASITTTQSWSASGAPFPARRIPSNSRPGTHRNWRCFRWSHWNPKSRRGMPTTTRVSWDTSTSEVSVSRSLSSRQHSSFQSTETWDGWKSMGWRKVASAAVVSTWKTRWRRIDCLWSWKMATEGFFQDEFKTTPSFLPVSLNLNMHFGGLVCFVEGDASFAAPFRTNLKCKHILRPLTFFFS